MQPFHPLSTVDQLASHLRCGIFPSHFTKEMPGINQLAKKLSPLEAAGMPTGAYRAGFRIKAQIPG